MINSAITQEVNQEYFVRMMIPRIREFAQAFEDEEEAYLTKLIASIESLTEYQLVVVGAGTLSYVETAMNFGVDYIAIEPLINVYLQKQIRFIVENLHGVSCIDREFGSFNEHLLGRKQNIFTFIFNILGYIEQPILQINKYIKPGDVLFIASWNKESEEAKLIRDKYFTVLNQTYSDNGQMAKCQEITGLYNLNDFDCTALRHYQKHKRIKNSITDILIVHC